MTETLEVPVPEYENALEEDVEELEQLSEEDDLDEPEEEVEEADGESTDVPNEDLEVDDFLKMPDDEGDDEQGDWVIAEGFGDEAGRRVTKILNAKQRTRARRLAVKAALLGLHHASAIHYTQGSSRWQGIADTRYSAKGEYPNYADCSAFATWCLWNGLYVPFRVADVVNGADWRAGYTGTMLSHGRAIRFLKNVRWADCVLYGAPGSSGRHTAVVVKTTHTSDVPMVVSHGSEGGPYYLPYNYRSDIQSIRRYIRYRV